jgi:hypothetical protein
VFSVDDMALVYLVNKPQVYSKILRWLFLFLEYDFKIIYKPSGSNLMVDALSKLPNQAKSIIVLIKPLMLICSPYNQNGYRVYDYLTKGMMRKGFIIS